MNELVLYTNRKLPLDEVNVICNQLMADKPNSSVIKSEDCIYIYHDRNKNISDFVCWEELLSIEEADIVAAARLHELTIKGEYLLGFTMYNLETPFLLVDAISKMLDSSSTACNMLIHASADGNFYTVDQAEIVKELYDEL